MLAFGSHMQRLWAWRTTVGAVSSCGSGVSRSCWHSRHKLTGLTYQFGGISLTPVACLDTGQARSWSRGVP
ncbi:hypothetical protein T484DRAFT_2569412 [Baffinella frigidus]|nr:hypothetical protein T484DRAFT_2569412 [Cryptophyta sp. CCMP2293]